MHDFTTQEGPGEARGDGPARVSREHRLVLVWSAADPTHNAESLRVGVGQRAEYGRDGDKAAGDGRVRLMRERPGEMAPSAPLNNPFLSRRQLVFTGEDDALLVENVGKRAIRVDGVAREGAVPLRAGSTLELDGQMLFLCTGLSPRMPVLAHRATALHPFRAPDESGIVGESSAAWVLRDRIAFAAAVEAHALILGESGTGKELVAQAIHGLSRRRDRALVARNAATFPTGLVEAELFGNAANYPNAGMRERPGIVGEADRSTLFLDEIGELPTELQSRLLRLLDEGGDYQRLGDAGRRRADVRIIAATNRDVSALKHDVAARLPARVAVPPLNDRREDILPIACHLIRRRAQKEPHFRRVLDDDGMPRMHLDFARALVTHVYTVHVRELDALLLRAAASSPGSRLDLTEEVIGAIRPMESPVSVEVRTVTADEIRAVLARHGGVQERVWRDLGMASRYVLRRAMRKYGIPSESGDE